MRTDALPTPANPSGSAAAPQAVAALESAMVLHYARLVRLAYLALPGDGERHRRALIAHGIVQNALPGAGMPAALEPVAARLPIPGRRPPRREATTAVDGASDEAYTALRLTVVREVLRTPHRWWPGLAVLLRPRVWGLRLFPIGGGAEELRLSAALRDADPADRAAYALITLEGLNSRQARAVLTAVGVSEVDCRGAVAAGQRTALMHPAAVAQSGEFDPCTLRTRPVDLPQRRRRIRWAAVLACGTVVAATVLVASLGSDGRPAGQSGEAGQTVVATPHGTIALTAAAPAGLWQHTARLDFTAWPDRSTSDADGAVVNQALSAWTGADSGATSSVSRPGPGTSATAPVAPVRVLWNGRLDGAAVVLLADATRLARYTRPDHPTAADPVRLELACADDSDVTSAGAVLLRSSAAGDRWLVAPWVVEIATRDLLTPDTLARPVAVVNGVTAALPSPPPTGCASRPTLQLRSSPQVAEHHAFLLTDLGGVTGAHLTFTPAPIRGAAQSPREATGSDALIALSRLACGLPALRDQDTKQVNTWEFALQPLPANQGTATWICTRADHWDGTGAANTAFLPPGTAPAVPTGSEAQGRSCSRFSQHIVADTVWSAPDDRRYLLVAGSRHVSAIQVGKATVTVPEHVVALPASDASSTVTGVLDIGGTISPLSR